MLSLEDRKIFSGKRASQGLSHNFKSVSRDKNAVFGNKLVKNQNDLIYDADPHSISNRFKKQIKPKTASQHQSNGRSPLKKYEYSPFKQRQAITTSQSQRNVSKGLSASNYMVGVKQFQKTTRECQQTAASSARKRRYNNRDNAEVEAFEDYGISNNGWVKKAEPVNFIQQNMEVPEYGDALVIKRPTNMLGLSKYEFNTTIEGKLLSKSNHHIDFKRNKTGKINNVNRVWYDNSKDIQPNQERQQKDKYNTLRRYHSFKSYSSHKLFDGGKRMEQDNGCGYGGMLDKYYEVLSPQKYELNHQRITDRVNYKNMTVHPEITKKLGTNLQYNLQWLRSVGQANNKKPIMQLSRSQRKLMFSRQVISPNRGCFR